MSLFVYLGYELIINEIRAVLNASYSLVWLNLLNVGPLSLHSQSRIDSRNMSEIESSIFYCFCMSKATNVEMCVMFDIPIVRGLT